MRQRRPERSRSSRFTTRLDKSRRELRASLQSSPHVHRQMNLVEKIISLFVFTFDRLLRLQHSLTVKVARRQSRNILFLFKARCCYFLVSFDFFLKKKHFHKA